LFTSLYCCLHGKRNPELTNFIQDIYIMKRAKYKWFIKLLPLLTGFIYHVSNAQWDTLEVIEYNLFGHNPEWIGSDNGSPYDCSRNSIQKNPVVNDQVWVTTELMQGYKYRFTYWVKARLPQVFCEFREGLDDGPGGNNLDYANGQTGQGDYIYTDGPFNAKDAAAMVCDSSFKYTSESVKGDGNTHFLKVVVTNVTGEGGTKPLRIAHCIIERAYDETYPYPVAPGDLTVTGIVKNVVNLEWIDQSFNELGFIIERRTENGEYVRYDTVMENITTYSDTILMAGTYFYRVNAYKSSGNSEYTNETMVSIYVDPPAAPSDLTCVPVSSRRIDLYWIDNSENELEFVVEYKTDGDWIELEDSPFDTNTTYYPVFGLLPQTEYSFRIFAFNNIGSSDTISSVVMTPSSQNDGVVFPEYAGVLNVRDFGAKGDGITDDTEALQYTLAIGAGKFVYLPIGEYLVSDRLEWPGDARTAPLILIGQDREKTVIRLSDNNPKYQVTGLSRSVIWTQEMGSADNFRNYIRNLTVNTGTGNHEAIGIQFMSNNMGAVVDVNIISGDGSGKIGLDLEYNSLNGPLLIKNVRIVGFDYGVKTKGSVNSQTIEHLTLENQNIFGLVNDGQVLSVRRINSINAVIAVYNSSSASVLTLIDSKLEGGDSDKPAIVNSGALFARNIITQGYQVAIQNLSGRKINEPGPDVKEFVSHDANMLFPWVKPFSLNLPVKENPGIPWEGDFENWANVQDYGAVPDDGTDDTQTIRDAINSGKTTICFPNGSYNVSGSIEITGNVERIIGMESTLAVGKQAEPVFKLVDSPSSSDTVEISHLSVTPTNPTPAVDNASANRTLVILYCKGFGGNHTGTGDVFYEDVGTGVNKPLKFLGGKGQHAWIRQLSNEPRDNVTHLENEGADVWILGHKTEQPGILIETRDSGRTEVCGGFVYSVGGDNTPYPMYKVVNSSMSATMGGSHYSVNYNPYEIMVRETHGDLTHDLLASSVPSRAGFRMLPLYVGYPDHGTGEVPAQPGNLIAEMFSEMEIKLEWQDNSYNEEGFVIEHKLEGWSYKIIDTVGTNTESYIGGNLWGGIHYFRIYTFNIYGNSPYSNEAWDTLYIVDAVKNNSPGGFPGEVTIHPNPSDGKIFLSFSENQPQKLIVKLFDLTGKLIYEDYFSGITSGLGIDAGKLERGCYVLELKDGTNVFRSKVILY